MKNHNILIACLIPLVLISCSKIKNESDDEFLLNSSVIYGHYIGSDNSKTSLYDEAYGDIVWNPLDSINLFSKTEIGSGSKYVTIDGGSIAEFLLSDGQNEVGDGSYVAVYPYSQKNIYDGTSINSYLPFEQNGYKANFDPNALLSAGESKTKEIGFHNVCGGIRFSVSKSGINKVVFRGNDNESLAGPISISFDSDGLPCLETDANNGISSITLNIDDTMQNGDGNYYYITMIPQTLKHGFTMEFHRDEEEVFSTTCDASVSIRRGVFSTVHLADDQKNLDRIINSKDLSLNGSANCYIINKAGAYKFKALIPDSSGNWRVPSDLNSAELLWETDNTSDKLTEGSLITTCFLNNSYVNFKTPSELINGNAVIAVRNYSGDIVWSWHIWICQDFDPEETKQKYKGCDSYFMDRNLGALTSRRMDLLTNGLFYQWGRKDPFPGSLVNKNEFMSTTREFKKVMVNEITGTLDYAIKNPDTFILAEENPFDWLHIKRNNELWQNSNKGVYDPCPSGWRVPAANMATGSWYGIDETSCKYETNYPGFSILLDSDKDEYAYYPVNGYIRCNSGKWELHNVGSTARYWSSSTSSQTANGFEIIISDGVVSNSFNFAKGGLKRVEGHSVRCVKE